MDRLSVVCGMNSEYDIAKRGFPGADVIQFSHSPGYDLGSFVPSDCTRIASFGFSGGVSPGFSVGMFNIASSITDGTTTYGPDVNWSKRIRNFVSDTVKARWFSNGQLNLANTVSQRATVQKLYNVDCIDDESYFVVKLAQQRKIPWVIARVISDDWTMSLPPASLTALNADGSVNILNILKSIATNPFQIPGLISLALDFERVKEVLERVTEELGEDFAL